MKIRIVEAYDYVSEVQELFEEYTNALIKGDPTFQDYLKVQNYEEELKNLQVKYGKPEGRLYLAYADNELAGCIGLKKIDSKCCEMKRLYVREQYRGLKIGKKLVDKITQDAKEIGYEFILLDTLPFLRSAVHMYQKMGFQEIECYNNSPMDSSIYMRMEL